MIIPTNITNLTFDTIEGGASASLRQALSKTFIVVIGLASRKEEI
jgi:hypothetical protein